jgi:hypothetical protein
VATKAPIDLGAPFVDDEAREWPPDEDRVKLVDDFLPQRIPGALGLRRYTRMCLYDMRPTVTSSSIACPAKSVCSSASARRTRR